MMRQAANDRRQAGDKRMFAVEGLELFGAADRDAFSDELHPNDEGNQRMAERLAPAVKSAIFGQDHASAESGRSK
jgi:lysophospholipase L1-like esterase